MKFTEILRKSETIYPAIAQEFEVSETTVRRWADGDIAPHPKIQRLIVAHVLHEKEVTCNCDSHRQVERCPYHLWFE